ncbi:MAG TPA: carboxypeptidase-like regulatory domain-containing protein [Gemmatimonadales bacterium]|nr:carboxypeptidase-like regulatory domain-containing protein [Gemmatimonadales bacterium]
MVIALLTVVSAALLAGAPAPTPVGRSHSAAAGDVTGAVSDSASGKPLGGADVLLFHSGQVVARTSTDAFGRYTVHNLPAGSYELEIRLMGFDPSRSSSRSALTAPE